MITKLIKKLNNCIQFKITLEDKINLLKSTITKLNRNISVLRGNMYTLKEYTENNTKEISYIRNLKNGNLRKREIEIMQMEIDYLNSIYKEINEIYYTLSTHYASLEILLEDLINERNNHNQLMHISKAINPQLIVKEKLVSKYDYEGEILKYYIETDGKIFDLHSSLRSAIGNYIRYKKTFIIFKN